MHHAKGNIWISAVIYVLVITVAIVIILKAGVPMLSTMKDKTILTTTENSFLIINKYIKDVASEGQGSQRAVPIDIKAGDIQVENGIMTWTYQTPNKVLEQRSTITMGELTIATGQDVTAIQIDNNYILQNTLIKVNITVIGTTTNWTTINTSTIINRITFKETAIDTNGTYSFSIADQTSSTYGNGYTELLETGTGISRARVKAHINTTTYEYDLIIGLESHADYLTADIQNLITR